MSNEQLLDELSGLFSLSVSIIARAGQVYAEIKKRGIVLEIRSSVFRDLIPKVADGTLTAEAVSAFADAPVILGMVSKCDVAIQRQLASGDTFPVLKRIGGVPVNMSVRDMYPDHIRNVIVGGTLLAPEDQEKQLKAKQGKSPWHDRGKKTVGREQPMKGNSGPAKEVSSGPSAPVPVQIVAGDAVGELVRQIEAELADKGTEARPTARQFAELAVRFGWGPLAASAPATARELLLRIARLLANGPQYVGNIEAKTGGSQNDVAAVLDCEFFQRLPNHSWTLTVAGRLELLEG